MRRILFSTVFLLCIATSPVRAAQIFIEEFDNDAYAVYLQGEELNGMFDTVIVDIRPDDGFEFTNIDEDGAKDGSFIPRWPGEAFTFVNLCLGAPVVECGHGFSVLGKKVSASEVEFTAGPLGRNIDTSNGWMVSSNGVLFANIHLPVGTATANMQLVRAGTVVADLTTTFGVPEPSAGAQLCLGVIGFCSYRKSERRTMR